MTATASSNTVGGDTLSLLEERIQKTVALVNRLREERDLARMEAADAKDANSKLSAELDVLRAEKVEVRGRLEKLLGHIDALTA
jgi:hypothetical protein